MPEVPNLEKTLHPGVDYAAAPVAPDIPDAPTNTRENIKVLVRIRPLLPQETGPVAIVGHEGNVIRVNGATANRQLQCHYDAVIGPEVCQDGMFAHVHDCTSAVLRGENATVFAYGQTGSGKTYTMFGPERGAGGIGLPGHEKGVIPLAVADLFTGLVSTLFQQKKISGNGIVTKGEAFDALRCSSSLTTAQHENENPLTRSSRSTL